MCVRLSHHSLLDVAVRVHNPQTPLSPCMATGQRSGRSRRRHRDEGKERSWNNEAGWTSPQPHMLALAKQFIALSTTSDQRSGSVERKQGQQPKGIRGGEAQLSSPDSRSVSASQVKKEVVDLMATPLPSCSAMSLLSAHRWNASSEIRSQS